MKKMIAWQVKRNKLTVICLVLSIQEEMWQTISQYDEINIQTSTQTI